MEPFTVTTKTDSIWAAAEHLLRRDAEELRESSTSSRDRNDWTGEEEAKADYDEHIAAADALASLSTAEPVQPPYGWVLVPAKPTREWIGAVADDGYADCDVAQLIASILSHAPAAPAAVTGPSVWGFRFPTGGKWHYTEHGPNDRSRKELIWRPFYEAPQPAAQHGDAEQREVDARHAAIYRWMLGHPGDAWSILDDWCTDEEAGTDELHDVLAARSAKEGAQQSAPTTQEAPAAALPEQDRARGAQGESK